MRRLLYVIGVLALCTMMAQTADAWWGRGSYGGYYGSYYGGCGWSGGCGWYDGYGRSYGRYYGRDDCGWRGYGWRGYGCGYSSCYSGCCSTCSSDVVTDCGCSRSEVAATPAAPEPPTSQSYETRRPAMSDQASPNLSQEHSMAQPQPQSP
jgi:hypothetical protein